MKRTLPMYNNYQYLKYFRNLYEFLLLNDPNISYIPVDEQADDQTPIQTIPIDAQSIFRKDLQPYFSTKHCNFGNRGEYQSFRIRLQTSQRMNPWQLENSSTRNGQNQIKHTYSLIEYKRESKYE